MRVAWVLALAISLGFFALLYYVPELRYTVVSLVKTASDSASEPKKVTAQKPEPTHEQVKEISRRVEKKKKEALAKEIRKLEQAREELERLEQERVAVAEPEKPDLFHALLEAIALKAEQLSEATDKMYVPEQAELRKTTETIEQLSESLADFTSPEDPHLAEAVKSLVQQTDTLNTRLDTLVATQPAHQLKQLQRAQLAAQEMSDLLRRAAQEWPTDVDWASVAPPASAEGLNPQELPALTPEDLDFATNPEALAAELEALTPPAALDEAALQAMSPAELYEHARQLDQTLQDTFANVRAAELAAVQGQPLAETLGSTMVYPGKTPDLAAELQTGPTGDRAEFQAYNAALDQAQQAVQAMRMGAESMVGKAQEYAGSGTGKENAQATQLRSAIQQSTTVASKKSGLGHVINLVPMMGAAYQLAGTAQGSDSTDPRRVNQGGPGTLMDPNASAAAAAKPLRLNESEITAQLLPARKLSRASKRQGWLYIDTWYVIGPFQRQDEHSSALDFKIRYPPETDVDLDATYPGKISSATRRPAELRWRFYQSNTLRITPPDEADGAVYYAYTEVFSENEEEVMIAVASDDAAKVWVNDLVVWQDTGLSTWQLDEGFRRILFRKGYNRILVRIESAPGVCAYSILLCPVDLSTAKRN